MVPSKDSHVSTARLFSVYELSSSAVINTFCNHKHFFSMLVKCGSFDTAVH